VAIQDFLITFRADTAQALAAINALYARVQQVDAQLNSAMGRRTNLAAPLTQAATAATNAARGLSQTAAAMGQISNVARRNVTTLDAQGKAVTGVANRFMALNREIKATKRAQEEVPVGRYGKAITMLETMRGQVGLTNQQIDRLQQSFRDQRAAQQFGTEVGKLNTRFRELDATMGRSGGMTRRNITNMRQLTQEMARLGGTQAGFDPRAARMLPIMERAYSRLPPVLDATARAQQRLTDSVARAEARTRGTFRTRDQELRALSVYEGRLQQAAASGMNVAPQLAAVANSINAVSAAAAQSKNLQQLNNRFKELDASMGRSGGMTRKNITEMRNVLTELNKVGTAGGADPRAKIMGPIINQRYAELPPILSGATQGMLNFNKSLRESVELAQQFRLPMPAPRQLGQGFQGAIDVLKTPGLPAPVYRQAGEDARFFADQLNQLPGSFEASARSFTLHARRIAEGIILYDALGKAVQAVSQQIKLAGDLAREQIRFEAVVGELGPGANQQFLSGISEIAVRTNTQLTDLASVMDTVAFATDRAAQAGARETQALQLMNRIGEFTNVTQRGLQEETENLIGIMNVFGMSMDEWENGLGGIVVMGDRSARAIQAITDTVSVAGRSARSAGVDFHFLGALGSEIFRELQGSMSGSAIGSQLNTIFGRLSDPSVQDNIEEITGGIIRFRDANNQLRDGDLVFAEIFAAIEAGMLTSREASEVFDQIVPPLNPGARSFVEMLQRVMPKALATAREGAQATGDDLSELSDKLVSGPAESFSRAIIGLQAAMTQLFSENITGGMRMFAGLLQLISNILSSDIGGPIAGLVVQATALAVGFRVLRYVGHGLFEMMAGGRLRAEQLSRALQGVGIGAATAQKSSFSMIGTLKAVGTTMKGLITSVAAFARAIALPFTIFIAIEQIGNIPNIVNTIQTQMDDAVKAVRIDPDLLARAFTVSGGPEGIFKDIATGASLFGTDPLGNLFGGADVSAREFRNIVALADAVKYLRNEGKLTGEVFQRLEAIVASANAKTNVQVVTVQDLIDAYNEAAGSTGDLATGNAELDKILADLTASTEAQTEATRKLQNEEVILASLTGARMEELERLNGLLREGAISVDDFSKAQSDLGSASKTVSAWMAQYGDQLSLIPGLQERVRQTGEDAATALLKMLLDNPATIRERMDILDMMVEIAEVNAQVAEDVANNPVEVSIETQRLVWGARETKKIFEWLSTGTWEIRRELDRSPIEPKMDLERLKAQATAALKIYKVLLEATAAYHRSTSAMDQAANPEVGQARRAKTRQTGANVGALERAIAELERAAGSIAGAGGDLSSAGKAWEELGKIREGDPRLDSGAAAREKQPKQTAFVDIGDLPPSVIAQIIKMAQSAQSRVIAAGGTVDTDETVAIFKDARFQRLISGIDQRFLTQAIQELTEVERRRLELEQQRLQDVTRSMVVTSGPIQSMVSAPVLAAGGGMLTGQGLNADPRLGNFTINVPINWSGMSLTQLQKFIYDSIAKAWIDAGRGG
jgi:hypothetical protein